GWAIFLRQKQKKLIMLPSEIMIWQPEFTDKTLSRKPGAVHLFSKPVTIRITRDFGSGNGSGNDRTMKKKRNQAETEKIT
ncbi:hypothetical protein, partial [Escherichia coli]|uniref:hypothetical protein n=1 Tax=Escherichia coli TaxID=562 RepID=UPI001BAFE309